MYIWNHGKKSFAKTSLATIYRDKTFHSFENTSCKFHNAYQFLRIKSFLNKFPQIKHKHNLFIVLFQILYVECLSLIYVDEENANSSKFSFFD